MASQESHEEFKAGHGVVGTNPQRASTLTFKAYKVVRIKADMGNSDFVYVGDHEGISSTSGFQLDAGESVDIPIDQIDKVWVVGGDADQGYSWLAA